MPLLEYKPDIRSKTLPSGDMLAIRPPWSASIIPSFSAVASSTSRRGRTGAEDSAKLAAKLPAAWRASAASSPSFSAAVFSSFRSLASSSRRSDCWRAIVGRAASISSASSSRSGFNASVKTADLRLPGSSSTAVNRFTGSCQPGRGSTTTRRAIPTEQTARASSAERSAGVCVECDSASTHCRKTPGKACVGNAGRSRTSNDSISGQGRGVSVFQMGAASARRFSSAFVPLAASQSLTSPLAGKPGSSTICTD